VGEEGGGYPLTTEVTKELQASARGLEKTGAGPIAVQRMGPNPSGVDPPPIPLRISRAKIVATLPANHTGRHCCDEKASVGCDDMKRASQHSNDVE